MTPKKIFGLVFAAFLLKLIFAYFLPMAGDEGYYWFWGQNLQLSYFDHPGMVAWLASLTNFLGFLPKWFALRFIFTCVSTLSFYIWLKVFLQNNDFINHPESQNSILKYFILFYFMNPMLGFGGVLATPDAPLLLFWGLSTYFLNKILASNKSIDYINLGLCLGLGFCSKYHIVLFPVCVLLGLGFSKSVKKVLDRKILLTVLFGFIFSLPTLIWNFQNDFASFKFQLNHGLSENSSYAFWWTSTYVLGQIFIFNPMLFFNQKNLLKKQSTWQWLFFLFSSFKAKVEANWPIASHAYALCTLDFKNKKQLRWALGYSSIIWLALPVFLISDLGQTKLHEMPTSLVVNALQPELSKYKPLYGPTYQISGLLCLLNNQPTYKLTGLSRYDFFDTLKESNPIEKKFFVLKYNDTSWPARFALMKPVIVAEFKEYNLQIFEFNRE